jgi:hypothetical protein
MRLPPSGPAGHRRPHGAGIWLALAAGWMAAACVLPGAAGLAALVVGVTALAASGVVAVRRQWHTVEAESALIAPAVDDATEDTNDAVAADAAAHAAELDRRLRRLREQHVARVDAALDEGRTDLAQELSDAYYDASLRALTDDADVPAPRG